MQRCSRGLCTIAQDIGVSGLAHAGVMVGVACALLAGSAEPRGLVPGAWPAPIEVSPWGKVLHDPTGMQTLTDVLASTGFAPVAQADPRYGFRAGATWLQWWFEGGPQPAEWLLELASPRHDHVQLYAFHQSGVVDRWDTGAALPFSQRPFTAETFVFPLALAANENLRVLVRIESLSGMNVQALLWEPAAFHTRQHNHQAAQGLYHGLLVAMALYHLILAVALRDRRLATCFAFVSTLGLLQATLSGAAFEYLWPNHPAWTRPVMLWSIAASALSGALLVMTSLSGQPHAAGARRALNAAMFVVAAAGLASPWLPYPGGLWLCVAAAGLCLAAALGLSASALFNGFSGAWLLICGGVAVALCLGAYALRGLMLIPGTPFIIYGTQAATVVVMAFISSAVVMRVRSAERATQDARVEAQERINHEMQVLNAALEQRVAARTDELQGMNRALQAADRRKDEMVAAVSHDFRSPLAAIRQNLQTVLRDLQTLDPARTRRFLQGALTQQERLSTMSTNLLDLAQIGREQLGLEPVDVAGLLRDCVDHARMVAEPRAVAITMELAPGTPPQVMGDAGRLAQVVGNLLDNAVKFSPNGGEVKLTAQPLDSSGGTGLCVAVQDSGPGVPEDAAERVFDPFVQLPTVAHAGQGSGLGLAIVRAGVRAHGGACRVEQAPGGGARFVVTLPARPMEDGDHVA